MVALTSINYLHNTSILVSMPTSYITTLTNIWILFAIAHEYVLMYLTNITSMATQEEDKQNCNNKLMV